MEFSGRVAVITGAASGIGGWWARWVMTRSSTRDLLVSSEALTADPPTRDAAVDTKYGSALPASACSGSGPKRNRTNLPGLSLSPVPPVFSYQLSHRPRRFFVLGKYESNSGKDTY